MVLGWTIWLLGLLTLGFAERSVGATCSMERAASGLQLSPHEKGHPARLVVALGGAPQLISEAAFAGWILDHGCRIAYAAADGAGGYENEGQSLWIYETESRRRKKLMASQFSIDEVIEAAASPGRTALIVPMHDSGLGATHVAVLDPDRGEVFLQRQARVLAYSLGKLILGFYDEDDWSDLLQGKYIPPRRVKSYSLLQLLDRPARVRRPYTRRD